jgi:type VI secretion system protein ImpJ
MTATLAPLWYEGMVMLPQHLQQLDRHWAARLEGRAGGLDPSGGWGLRSLAIDQSLLAMGRVAVTACRAVLPDGSVVELPEDLGGPLLREVPTGTTERLLKLALPLAGGDRPITEAAGASPGLGRVRQLDLPVRDATAADRRVETIGLAQPALRLLLEGEPEDDLATLPIARLRREEGPVLLAEDWLPPALDCRAHPRYGQMLREIEALLKSRGDVLAARIDPSRAGGDVAALLDIAMLQAVNRAQPVFSALAQGEAVHPATAYRECLRLAGELSTFAPSRRPPALPAWRQDDPTGCFRAAIAAITLPLLSLSEAAATALPLSRHQHGLWASPIRDRPLLQEASQLVLAVSSARHAEEVRSLFPAQVKIGPLESIRDLVSLQIPGLALSPLPVAPRELPFRTGTAYFEIERGGEIWRRIQTTVAIGLHVGGEWPELALELWAIRRSR